MAIFVGDALLAHAKAGCYVCGRGARLVDMEIQIEGEGALALCTGCITTAAEAARLTFNAAAVAEQGARFVEERRQFSPDRVAELEAELVEAHAKALVYESFIARHLTEPETAEKASAPARA